MAQIVDDFVLKFHNLEGVTVADRQKNIFWLLHQNAPVLKGNVEFLEAISTSLNPRTFLESLFKVDFLIYFRRTEELLQLLKEGNDVFVSKIVKQVWFFKEAFNEVSASQLVNEILPSMSFSVRMKVLRKLSRYSDCEKFDHIFDAVVARYGIFIASKFIIGCGPVKVRQVLVEYPMKLTSTQLRILYEKDNELIDFYFTHSNHSITGYMYGKLLKFIFVNDPILFAYLKKKYIVPIKLGRRTTKKFVDSERSDIIKNPHNFHFLNMPAVLRKIGKDFIKLFKNSLPDNMGRCINRDWLFKSFPKKYHYDLFVKAFQDHYDINFLNHPFLIDEDLLKLISENLERANLAKLKVDEGHDEYLKYLRDEDSIRLIKEKINLTSNIEERGKLIKYLVETCHINNNIDALLSVMKYFCFRHKDDGLKVHLQFINNIENLFGFTNFTEEMWNYLNELLMIHTLKFDQNLETSKKIQTLMPLVNFNLGTSAHQKLSYLEFLFKKGESIDELIKEYSNDDMEFPPYKKYDKQFEKYFLLFVINNVATDSLTEKDIIFNCKLIKEIDHWNCSYKNDQLCFYNFTKLAQAGIYAIANYNIKTRSVYTNVFRDFHSRIFTLEENMFRKHYLKIFWDRYEYYIILTPGLTDIQWFLKHDPLTILTNFEKFFHALTLTDTDPLIREKIWFTVKKYSHLQLDEKSVQLCLAKLSDETYVQMKPNFIPCLSVLMKPGEYAAFADTYKPANEKLDLTNVTEIRLYSLQCAIAKQFRNTKSSEVLTSLLNYCAADYFKYTMGSLYSMLYHTPENMLPQYLNYLSTKAVSVRKHALFLTCELSTSTQVENIIRLLNKQEGVQSLQKHTIQYFVKNPSDPFFELIKLNMLFINKTDDESLNNISAYVVNIPTKYKAQYIQHAWEFLEKTVDVWKKLAPLKRDLLSCVTTEIIGQIPLELGLRIIQEHFMTERGSRDLSNVNSFIFNFVCVRTEKNVIFETIFAIADQCNSKRKMFSFFHDWHHKIMSLKCNDLKYLEPFVTYYEKKVSVVERFRDFIRIFFLKLKLDWPENGSVNNLAVRVVTFFHDVVSNYGSNIIHLFAPVMNFNVSNYFIGVGRIDIYDFYFSMIRHRPLPTVANLVLQELSIPYYNDNSVVTFDKLLQQIKDIDDIGVQINLQSKFRDYLAPEEMEVDEDSSDEYGFM